MAFDFDQPQPLAEAIDAISKRTPVGTALGSAQISQLPRELREAAMFSARVESARAMQEVRDKLADLVAVARDPDGLIRMDRSRFIAELQKTANRLGLRTQDQEKRGSVEDFGSERRLRLIYEQQVGAAQARAYYLQGQDPDILDAWPAQELVRVRDSKIKRDWKRRWTDAGGPGHPDGRLIALKTDPVWRRLSRFGRPYPPFDYNSGMGVEEIDREEAEARGLIRPDERLQPDTEAVTPQAELATLDPQMREAFERAFTANAEGGMRNAERGMPPPTPTREAPGDAAPAPAPRFPVSGLRSPVSEESIALALAAADPIAALIALGFTEDEARQRVAEG